MSRFVTVKGRLTYSDGTPIANKKIEIHSEPKFTYTDSNGCYEIPNVEIGIHTFKVFDSSDKLLVSCSIKVSDSVGKDSVDVTEKNVDVVNTNVSNNENIIEIDLIKNLKSPSKESQINDEEETENVVQESQSYEVEKTVKTGDSNPTSLMFYLAFVSCSVMVFLLFSRKYSKDEDVVE